MVIKHNRKRPLIGVTTSDRKNFIFWCFIWLGVQLTGGTAIRLQPSKPLKDLTQFDGFIISGGTDIHPSCYGQSPLELEYAYDTARDDLETTVIKYATEHHIPLFGICRGMQMINVVHGGNLHQEATAVLEDFLPNRSLLSKVIGRREITIAPHSRLFKILDQHGHYYVNSIHHQAINQTAQGFEVSAKEKNGLVQAIESIEHNHPLIFGVQWHPELMLHDRAGRKLFRELINKSRERNRKKLSH